MDQYGREEGHGQDAGPPGGSEVSRMSVTVWQMKSPVEAQPVWLNCLFVLNPTLRGPCFPCLKTFF